MYASHSIRCSLNTKSYLSKYCMFCLSSIVFVATSNDIIIIIYINIVIILSYCKHHYHLHYIIIVIKNINIVLTSLSKTRVQQKGFRKPSNVTRLFFFILFSISIMVISERKVSEKTSPKALTDALLGLQNIN